MQIPCVATRIAGIPELIRDGVEGLLVAPSDELELASAIERLIDDPNLCRTLGCAGRERVMVRFDSATNTRLLANVFLKRLLSRDAVAPSVRDSPIVRLQGE
jgi:colanic acid/amylovoran biosynthesis glycosyltransferase